MKLRRLTFVAIFLFLAPLNGSADWGKEPAFAEIDRYSKISLGFASQNLKSPISYFGHSFLIFHNSDFPDADSLAVEFTGDAPDLLANISALFNSVPGRYSLTYLIEKIREYDYENRSIWLYKLTFSENEVANIKTYLLDSQYTGFEYNFSQNNCAFYIAQALSHARDAFEYKRDGIFITPASTLRWARTEGILSSEKYLPSTQLIALHEFEPLSDTDQLIVIDYLNHINVPRPYGTNLKIGNALSAITEYMIPREGDAENRNYLFSIKRDFPTSSGTRSLVADDPSRSIGSNSISALFLLNRNSLMLTISPGFVRLENEQASGQHNIAIETLRSDFLVDTKGTIRLEEFHLVRMESNQPSGYLRDGFTQAFDVSYANYRSYFDDNYKEAKILFGRGVSWLYGGNTISFLPMGSIIKTWRGSSTSTSGQIEFRLKDYKQLSEYVVGALQVDQLISHTSEIQQSIVLDVICAINREFSISIHMRRVIGIQKSSTMSGIGITGSF